MKNLFLLCALTTTSLALPQDTMYTNTPSCNSNRATNAQEIKDDQTPKAKKSATAIRVEAALLTTVAALALPTFFIISYQMAQPDSSLKDAIVASATTVKEFYPALMRLPVDFAKLCWYCCDLEKIKQIILSGALDCLKNPISILSATAGVGCGGLALLALIPLIDPSVAQ